jgi:hypothetical protein
MKQLNGTHIAVIFILLISTALVSAETLTIKLPAETMKLRPSTMTC